jgi:sialate O-acetylesterase
MNHLCKQCALIVVLFFFTSASLHADVSLPGVFGDNMVLQRGRKIPVWGNADPGETVTVIFAGKTTKTIAGWDGGWKVFLGEMKAGGPYELVVSGMNTVTITDVMIGEVWLCSGQSNMWWPVKQLHDIPGDVAPENNANIRLFSVWSPESESYGEKPVWVPCTTETLREFSAVAYFFGRYLQQELSVTVGLIHSSMGGSVPEAWMTRAALESNAEFRPIVAYWDSISAAYPGAIDRFNNYLSDVGKANVERKTLPVPPEFPFVPKPLRIYMKFPQGIYNDQLAPIIPYGIRGVIWYQGESSTDRAYQYRSLFPAMIGEWRKAWNQGDFPFVFAQLANYSNTNPLMSIPELREAQLMALSVPNTSMAVTIDVGENNNVHYNDKWDVGKRLALAALHDVYRRNSVSSGPIYESMKIQGNTIRLRFSHIDKGLEAGNDGLLLGFTIAADDRVFYEAQAAIDGDEVVVTSEKVVHPVSVRYGWESCPKCTLYNTAGLPASPFRTDTWTGVTEGRTQPL